MRWCLVYDVIALPTKRLVEVMGSFCAMLALAGVSFSVPSLTSENNWHFWFWDGQHWAFRDPSHSEISLHTANPGVSCTVDKASRKTLKTSVQEFEQRCG